MWPPSDDTRRALIPLVGLSMIVVAVYVVLYILEQAEAGSEFNLCMLRCCILPSFLLILLMTVQLGRRGVRSLLAWGYERSIERKGE
jgi:hypothetical protein